MLTTGTEAVDELLDGVRVGDNLVVRIGTGVPVEPFVSAYVEAMTGTGPLVVVRAEARRWQEQVPGGLLLDWTVSARDDADGLERPIVEGGVDGARATLEDVDREVGPGSAFLFDSLTAIQERWGGEAALDLFLATCPRLYRRGSVAMWIVERERHSTAFLNRLQDITQVVVDVTLVDAPGEVDVTVVKADGRPHAVAGRRQRLLIHDGQVESVGPVVSGRERIGTLIRAERTSRGLSQAELARRIAISPSALSQVERGVRGLSGESLTRLWEALGVPYGPDEHQSRGYRVSRRGGEQEQRLAEGVRGRLVLDDRRAGQMWELHLLGGAGGRNRIFDVKAPETVVVLEGVVDLEVGGHPETLQEGDAVAAIDVAITAWANPTDEPAWVLWAIARP